MSEVRNSNMTAADDSPEALKADRNLYKGKYRSIIALMDDTRQKVQEIVDHIGDEDDRAYFGSSNHADWLRDLVDDMDSWSFDAMLPKGDINKMEGDPYAEIRDQRARAREAESVSSELLEALKLAKDHSELSDDVLDVVDAAIAKAEGRSSASLKGEGAADPTPVSILGGIKPLEWKGPTQKALVAEPLPGFKYTILDDERGVDWSATSDEVGWSSVNSVDEAKAACQADFDARLRSFFVAEASHV